MRNTPEGLIEFTKWLGISIENLKPMLLGHAKNFSQQILTEEWKQDLEFSGQKNPLSGANGLQQIDRDFTNIGKGI